MVKVELSPNDLLLLIDALSEEVFRLWDRYSPTTLPESRRDIINSNIFLRNRLVEKLPSGYIRRQMEMV